MDRYDDENPSPSWFSSNTVHFGDRVGEKSTEGSSQDGCGEEPNLPLILRFSLRRTIRRCNSHRL